ncbi:MAG: cation-translocating P-type ATPase [Chloroflexota bacterium]|nr:cation-translocating P-type ATPase [Chloroflexota bacterium]
MTETLSSQQSDQEPLVFDVVGMDCGDCARSVERAVGQLPGVDRARVSLGAGMLTVHPTASAPDAMARAVGGAVDRAGYTATLRDGMLRAAGPARWWRSRRLLPAAVAALLWAAAFALEQTSAPSIVTVALYAVAIVTGGAPIMRAAWQGLRARVIDMNTLMTISVIGAALLGEWSEGALVVVLFTLGATLQAVTFERTRAAIRRLLDLSPAEARLVRDGVEVNVPVAALAVGDLVRVRPGERVPADGTVRDGHSALDQSAITGESLPVEVAPGAAVFAGTLNGAGTLLVSVDAVANDSTLTRIIHLVEEAQSGRAPSQQAIDRFAAIYTPAVLVLAVLLAAGGALLTGDVGTWVYRALVLLVIACPCALVISTPVAIVSAIGAATRQGVLVKGGGALERVGRARVVAVDKTGTLTLGRPWVAEIVPTGELAPAAVLRLAAAVEQHSEHPLARAVVARALHDGLAIPAAEAFTAVVGRGATATSEGQRYAVGNAQFLGALGVARSDLGALDASIEGQAAAGRTALLLARLPEGSTPEVLGLIAVADRLRPGAVEAVAAMRKAGAVRVVMLTGDSAAVATAIGRASGVDEVRAGLLPAEKAAAVNDLRRNHGAVVMVGDGINDAPALATADVGVAMGTGGTDVALESADLALMRDDLDGIAGIMRLSRRTLAIIQQNVTLSLATKLAALLLGSLGFVNLWVAVLADVGTSVVVTLNGLRLARQEERTSEPQPVGSVETPAASD